jgi:hypothetical protein
MWPSRPRGPGLVLGRSATTLPSAANRRRDVQERGRASLGPAPAARPPDNGVTSC